jgi:hypothetical protein
LKPVSNLGPEKRTAFLLPTLITVSCLSLNCGLNFGTGFCTAGTFFPRSADKIQLATIKCCRWRFLTHLVPSSSRSGTTSGWYRQQDQHQVQLARRYSRSTISSMNSIIAARHAA